MQAADKEDAVLIAVTRDGKVVPEPGQRADHRRSASPKGEGSADQARWTRRVYIKADARARYEKVEDVVDNLRAAGVDQIGLAHRAVAATSKKPRVRRARAQLSVQYLEC